MSRNVSHSPSRARDDASPARAATARDDVELARDAAAGDGEAFDDLYRRHADAAWRVAYAVTGNRDDAADAVAEAFTRMLGALTEGRLADLERVRSYLLATTRNAAIDVLRRSGRLSPLDDLSADRTGSLSAGPSDQVMDGLDASLVAAAFLGLPERWRSVLWLTEVEGMAPAEAARLLGVSANNVAQLAVRARAGLRQRFLQAHVREDVGGQCAFTREHLGAYVGGALAPRDTAKVDQHLADCPTCRAELAELEDLGSTLRRVAIPLPLALGLLAREHWLRVSATDTASRRGLAALAANRGLTGATVTLLGVGIIALGILGRPDPMAGPATRPAGAPAVGSRPVLAAETAAATQAAATPLPLAVAGVAPTTEAPATTRGTASGSPAGTGGSTGGSGAGGSTTAPGGSSSGPTVQLSTQINLSPAPVDASAGTGEGTGSSTGVSVTTPAGTESEGQAPSGQTSTSGTPSASVSATVPGVGTTTVTTPSLVSGALSDVPTTLPPVVPTTVPTTLPTTLPTSVPTTLPPVLKTTVTTLANLLP